MKKGIAIAVCLLLWGGALYSNAVGKNIGDDDGNDWVGWPGLRKAAYIAGFINGSSTMAAIAKAQTLKCPVRLMELSLIEWPEKFDKQDEITEKFAKVDKRLREDIQKLEILNTPVGQMVDGLDAFYSDFSKRKIKLQDAIYVVKMQIDGAPEEVVDAQVRWIRTSASERVRISFEFISKLAQFVNEGRKGPQPLNPGEIKAKDGRVYPLWEPRGYYTEE